MWRTSWLSREVILLPAFMALVFAYGAWHYFGNGGTMALGAAGILLCIALFICTAMIYACIRFLQEWASPLTISNFILLGAASGYTFAALYAVIEGPELTRVYAKWAIVFTLVALCSRVASLVRNARIRPKSTLQSAIGVKHPHIEQKAQGFMGGSFNTREFFHGRTGSFVRLMKWSFLVLAFPIPIVLLAAGAFRDVPVLIFAAFVFQYTGMLAERWYFFAQARHPQNLYYQAMS